MIQCGFVQSKNALAPRQAAADGFIDDCARTALPGVDPAAAVEFVDHSRSEMEIPTGN